MNIIKQMKTTGFVITQCLLVLLIVGNVFFARAQEQDTIIPIDKNPEDILRNVKPRSFISGFNFWQDDFTGHWAGLDFGFNTFINTDYSGYDTEFMKSDLFSSNSTYVNFIQQSIGVQKNRNTIGLVTGLGLHLQSYRLKKNTTLHLNEFGVIEPRYLYFDQNQKSKFSMVSLIIPLLAEFQIPINHYENRFYISAGTYISFRMSSHTKIKYRSDRKEKLKIPGQYSIHNYKYGAMLRAGYRWINIYATYDLIPLFENNKGPELTPFTFGITLVRF
jgi:hypothetical protein